MKRLFPAMLFILAAAPLPAAGADGFDYGAPPQRALAITDPAVVNYGVRARVSGKYFNKVKLAARDMLGKWSEPMSTRDSNFESTPGGFNTVLDPGYDLESKNAGGVRTTPVQLMWTWRSDIAACTPAGSAHCATINKDLSRKFHWLQTRKWGAAGTTCNRDDIIVPPAAACANAQDGSAVAGGVLCNQRGVPPYWQAAQREQGFHVIAAEGHCFDAQNVCMSNLGLPTRTDGRDPGGWCFSDTCTTHQFNELGTICTMEAQFADPAKEIYMNVGVFIFPNGFVENAGSGANAGFLDPVPAAWQRPRTLHMTADGDYFGYIPVRRYGVYTGRGGPVGTFTPTSHPLRQSAADGTFRWYASGFPSGPNDYDERNRYDELFGSYFRMGDDTAFYADVRQMQIHSIDRDAVSTGAYGANAVAGCGFGPVYTGQLDATTNEPIYFFERVPQCLRPKSYWDAAKQKWVACDPYDTFLEDGVTPNPDRDDAKPIYPGGSYPAGTQTTCGAQTNAMSPFTSVPPEGTGWSALRIDTLALDTVNNKVDFSITGDEWRLELALLFDFATECTVYVPYISTSPACDTSPGYQAKRKWAIGSIMIQNLLLAGTAKLYSVDDYSCGQTNGGCPDPGKPQLPWQSGDDGLVRPDQLYIDLNLATTQITFHPDPPKSNFNVYGATRNAIRAVYQDLSADGYSCYATVYGNCAFTLAKGTAGSQANPELLVPQIVDALRSEFQNQFSTLINDLVNDLNASLPNFGALLGDPWNFGNALVDVGIFLTGASGDSTLDSASRKVWPVRFLAPPAGRRELIDINASLGFRPIAFRPPNAQGVMLIDSTPNIDKSPPSFFAVPTMVHPDTAACFTTVKGTGAVSINASGTANTWYNSGASYTYNNPTGWVSGIGTASGRNFGRFFFNRTNWKWSRIIDVVKSNMNPIAGVTGNAYRIEPNRSTDFTSTNWGTSEGWVRLNATFTQGNFAALRVGDQFWFDAYPNAKYTIKAINAGFNAIQLDLLAGYANRTTPLTLTGTAAYTVKSRRCAGLDSRYPTPITDRQYNYVDHLLETFGWVDPKTGDNYSAAGSKRVIQPYYMAPFTAAPSWCMTPKVAKQEEAAMAARYPMTTWLSFNSIDLKPPGATSMSNPSPWARHTLGDWDFIPGAAYGGRGIVRQHQNDPANKEPNAVDYDASVHIHQRAFNQLALALVSSGAACIEFSDTDPETGETTPWSSFLTTERFAAVFPELQIKYPKAKVKLRISPQAAPRVRTGIGTISYTPGPNIVGSPPITNEPYTLGVALPDLQIGVTVVDPVSNLDVDVFKMNWNAVIGLYLRSMRVCHPDLDPDRNADKCTTDPAQQILRTVSGYWQLYVDYGNDNLGLAFEKPANTRDGFEAGRFTRSEFPCTGAGCVTTVSPGTSKFEVVHSFCGLGCDTQGVAQSLVTLLDATFSLYLDTRASTEFLSVPLDMDILYVGPDGPNDDGLGVSTFGSRGDYLGLYIRQFGNLDLAGLMEGLSFAPTMIPQAVIPVLENVGYLNTNSPALDVALRGADQQQSEYTYRLDGGFWRTPRSAKTIELSALTEGGHVIELKSLVPTANGSVPQAVPTRMEFTVDTLAPEVQIPPARHGTYERAVALAVSDLQTPADQLSLEFSLDDGKWISLDEPKVELRGVSEGRHTLRVRATDLAGNTGAAAREIVVGRGAGCGGCSSSEATAEVLMLSLLVMLALRRRKAAASGRP